MNKLKASQHSCHHHQGNEESGDWMVSRESFAARPYCPAALFISQLLWSGPHLTDCMNGWVCSCIQGRFKFPAGPSHVIAKLKKRYERPSLGKTIFHAFEKFELKKKNVARFAKLHKFIVIDNHHKHNGQKNPQNCFESVCKTWNWAAIANGQTDN